MIEKKPIEELVADCKKYLPAYPVITKTADGTHFVHWGMSLRDYFAAHAPFDCLEITNTEDAAKDFAEWAYHYADTMLAEREK